MTRVLPENSAVRSTCLDCVRKHLGQASALLVESKLGYPIHHWFAVGHLAEAETEALQKFPKYASKIRLFRLAVMEGRNTPCTIAALIDSATALTK